MSTPFIAKSHSFWPTTTANVGPKGSRPSAVRNLSEVRRISSSSTRCNRLPDPSHRYLGRQKTKMVLACRQARRSFTVGVVIDTSVVPGKPRWLRVTRIVSYKSRQLFNYYRQCIFHLKLSDIVPQIASSCFTENSTSRAIIRLGTCLMPTTMFFQHLNCFFSLLSKALFQFSHRYTNHVYWIIFKKIIPAWHDTINYKYCKFDTFIIIMDIIYIPFTKILHCDKCYIGYICDIYIYIYIWFTVNTHFPCFIW